MQPVAYQSVRCVSCWTILPVAWVNGECVAYHNSPVFCPNNGTSWKVPTVQLQPYTNPGTTS